MYRTSFNPRQFNWRAYFNTQTPEGRFGIFLSLLLLLLIVSAIRTTTSDGVSRGVAVFIGRLLGLLIGFTLHEWAHAYTAYHLGGYRALVDPSRLSLDPRVHVDPLGLFLALVTGFGWARPVPVYPQAFYPHETRGMMTVAFAGPLMNLLVALAFGILLRLLYAAGAFVELGQLASGAAVIEGSNPFWEFLLNVLATIIFFNVLQFVFNLLPLAPLDGWRVLLGLLPNEQSMVLARYERESTLLLYFLIILGFVRLSPLGALLFPLIRALFQILTGVVY